MQIHIHPTGGYTMFLSADDTEAWATRSTRCWPCSTLRGKRLRVEVDTNGLTDLMVNGRQPKEDEGNGGELQALVSDHLPPILRHLWPVWEKED